MGYDEDGYDEFGYDRDGYDRKGRDQSGNPKEDMSEVEDETPTIWENVELRGGKCPSLHKPCINADVGDFKNWGKPDEDKR